MSNWLSAIALFIAAISLAVMAAVQVYESPENVCQRRYQAAVEGNITPPPDADAYRAELEAAAAEAPYRGLNIAERRRIEGAVHDLANFDRAYERVVRSHENLMDRLRNDYERRLVSCRGDWRDGS